MKSIGEIMQELGLNQGGTDGVKSAFVKNLIRVANEGQVKKIQVKPEAREASRKLPEQLEFNFDSTNADEAS